MPAQTLNSASIPIHCDDTIIDLDFDSDSDSESDSIDSTRPILEPAAQQHIYIQDVAYKSQPKWKSVLYSLSPHAPWWKSNASLLVDRPCSRRRKEMSVPRRKPRIWLRCGLGTLAVLYATERHPLWSFIHADWVQRISDFAQWLDWSHV